MRFFHDITKMSANGLLSMQRSIRARLIEEDAAKDDAEQPYGVRKYPDWKLQADEIEAELNRRGITYEKIKW